MTYQRLSLIFFLIVLLSACGQATNPTPGPPTLTPTITVPPLPSLTPWSTKTPRPTRTPTPTPLACWGMGSQMVEDQVPSDLLPESIPVLIYLPPCYDQFPESNYPALYLFHGQGFDQTQWPRLGITALADERIVAGTAPSFIIVMPTISDWDGPLDSTFGQAVIEELIPYIEANYHANSDRASRQVGGISRGASWALHLGLNEWETFSAMGLHSLPVFYEDAPNLPYWLDAIPTNQMPAIYVDFAESDQSAIRRSARQFLDLLDEREIPYTFTTAPGTHVESYWASQMDSYLQFYVSNWE